MMHSLKSRWSKRTNKFTPIIKKKRKLRKKMIRAAVAQVKVQAMTVQKVIQMKSRKKKLKLRLTNSASE